MPILDPSSQYQLINEVSGIDTKYSIRFYLRYLHIASHFLYRNFSTIDTSLQFKKDLSKSIQLMNDKFECELPEEDFQKPIITDYYKYLYEQIIMSKKLADKKSYSLQGRYFKLFQNYETKYFRPDIFLSNNHSWFFTDTNISILSIRTLDQDLNSYQLIKLEIDLMAAAGFILILCVKFSTTFNDFLIELIERNQFSEIHINFSDDTDSRVFLSSSKNHDYLHFKKNNAFIYLYTHFIDKKEVGNRDIYKQLKKIPRVTIIQFAVGINKSIKKPSVNEIYPFPYEKNGFNKRKLRIFLTNVPLYDTDKDDPTNLIPTQTSGVTLCYVSSKDFLKWNNKLVEIMVDNNFYNFVTKYVKFDDLHIINKDLFVKDMLTLAQIKQKDMNVIDEIEKKVKEILKKRKKKKKVKKNIFLSLIKDEVIKNNIEYATYAYAFFSNSLNNDFSIHRPQIYTIWMACKKLLSKKNNIRKKLEDELHDIETYLRFDVNEGLKLFNESCPVLMSAFYKMGNWYSKFLDNISPELKSIIYRMISNKPNNYADEVILNANNNNNNNENSNRFGNFVDLDDDDDSNDFIIKEEENFFETLLKLGKEKADQKFKKRKAVIEEELKKYREKCHKGVVYQVETGEGKSCIIAIIAAILALNGKTVHITSSNIKLANRDYMNSFEFFKLINIKSAVLLHEDELPTKSKKSKSSQNNETNTNSTEDIHLMSHHDDDDGNDDNDNGNNDDDDYIDFFKDNFKNYYNNYTKEKVQFSKYYKNKDFDYYNPEQFRNSHKMNFGVCGLDNNNNITSKRPKIIFSTFVNFECFYLKIMELCPAYIHDYYRNCSLLIDEADSILIDEISNGTIVSREMKSNTKEILKYVYDHKDDFKEPEKMFNKIIDKWPNCKDDLTVQDVIKMYSEIDLVNKDDEFQNGRKYSIEEHEVKNNKRKKKLISQALNLTKDILLDVGKGLIEIFSEKEDDKKEDDKKDDESDDDDDDDDEDDEDDEDEEEEDDDDDDSPVTVFREIVPFDYDHKGILEPYKEFGGFIQQFIAIKESEKEENKNMIIKDMSMSYLYVSHPIFVRLYSSVCGFTGTIGNKKDKQIYAEQYDLETMKVPRNKSNQRVEFPILLCDDITDRNKKIVKEVLEFHKRGNPVLVIFQDLKEIENVSYLLNTKGIKYINIFNGKNDEIKPDNIAGIRGAVSLGTNVCGRGTNIIAKKEPLHVIISYYTSNTRVMDQAHGRTARQGRKGTSRIICLKNQYLYPTKFNEDGIEATIGEFEVKKEIQSQYIEFYSFTKPWIFSNKMKKQKLTREQIEKLREARINVNRIVAYNFQFPLKMSVSTFLKIQIQKIFSILNCPNSEFTWKLFQKYVREMILESWSLKINQIDEEFFDKEENREFKEKLKELKDMHLNIQSIEYKERRSSINKMFEKNISNYKDILSTEIDKLETQLEVFLPQDITEIIPLFMHIFNIVIELYQNKILSSFTYMENAFVQLNKGGFICFQTGFKPYSLLTESGARINYKTFDKMNYIKDPELRYMKQMPNNKLCWLSITEKIDDLFNLIFQKINKVIGGNTFLRFFMRRTLCGCEFGLCLDLKVKNIGFNDTNCLIDKDPLLIFTISVKSVIPILAGVLIILLVYAASLSKDIAKWFVGFPEKLTEETIKKAATLIISVAGEKLVHFALDKLIKFLKKVLKKQINKLKEKNSGLAQISVQVIESLLHIFSSKAYEKINDKVSKLLGDKIKVTLNWHKFIQKCLDPARIMKISFLLLLCLATFILNFNTRNEAIENKNDKKEETNKDKNEANNQKRNSLILEKDEEFIKHEKEDAKEYEKAFKKKDKLKTIEERDEKKVKHTIELLKKKNKHLVNDDKDYKDNYDENAFSEDEDDYSILSPEKKKIEEDKAKRKLNDCCNSIKQSYIYKFMTCEPLEVVKKATNFVDEKIEKAEKISNGVATIKKCIKDGKLDKRKYLKMTYKGLKKPFIQQLTVYATNMFPSILQVIGYNIHRKKQELIVESTENGSLDSYIKIENRPKIPPTEKLIIAYGIVRAMENLHIHKIVHRNLQPINIMLDSNFHPYVSEFYLAKQIETKVPYLLQKMAPGFMPPEFYFDFESNQNSFKIDVYSFGITLYILLTEKDPFKNHSPQEIITNTLKDIHPSFPNDLNRNWIDLIQSCWSRNPEDRPDFIQIRKLLESNIFVNKSINSQVFNKYKDLFQ